MAPPDDPLPRTVALLSRNGAASRQAAPKHRESVVGGNRAEDACQAVGDLQVELVEFGSLVDAVEWEASGARQLLDSLHVGEDVAVESDWAPHTAVCDQRRPSADAGAFSAATTGRDPLASIKASAASSPEIATG